MTHEDFLQTIDANPDEDAPRLVYADWLQEHQEAAFGQFIQVQCALARLPEENDRWLELKIQEEALWRDLARRWAEHFLNLHYFTRIGAPLPGDTLRPERFTRGLLELGSLWIEADLFVRESPRWPFLLRVDELQPARMSDDLFASPQLWRVRALNCERCNVQDGTLECCAGAGHLRNVQRLDFYRNYVGPTGTAALARCPSLTGLTELVFDENRLGDDGVRALLAAPWCRQLTALALSGNGITDAGAQAIAASPHLAGLRRLRLANNPITAAGCRAVRSSPHLQAVSALELPEDEEVLTDEGEA